jgi:facilitated trehalose transporter
MESFGRASLIRIMLQFLRGHDDIGIELSEIQDTIELSMQSSSSFVDLFYKPHLLKPFVISLVLMFGQQMCGINAIIFFSVDLFNAAGTTLDSFVETIIVAVVQVVGTVLAALVIDKLGRRPLTLLSGFLMAVSAYTLGN